MQNNAPSFVYARDDARRRIRITASRALHAPDLIAIIDRQAHEGTWAYGTLYDLRDVVDPTPRDDAIAVAEHVERMVGEYGRRGPVALVTRSSVVIGSGYAYTRDSAGRAVEVFWDVDEAESWLVNLNV